MELVDLVRRYVSLKGNGSECRAPCPYHADSGESLRVGATWRCLGCAEHETNGPDAIGWLMSWSSCTREEAVEQLGNGSLPEPKPIAILPLKRPPFWGIKALVAKPAPVKVWIHDQADGVAAGRQFAPDRVHLGLCYGRSFADLSAVSGRDCVLFPANDRDSLQTMRALAELLYAAGHKTVRWVDVDGLAEGKAWPGEMEAEAALAYARSHARKYDPPKPLEAPPEPPQTPPSAKRRSNGAGHAPNTPTPSYTEQAKAEVLGRIVYRKASSIQMRATDWLWPGKIPLGEICVIQGDPGLGKSQITASICAIVTRGGKWPVTREDCPAGDVVLLSAEDSASKTIAPRLRAAGADLDRVTILQAMRRERGDGTRGFSLAEDVTALAVLLQELPNPMLVIVDPVSAYQDPGEGKRDIDSHKNVDVRSLLRPVSELVERLNITMILINHLTKAGGRAIARGQGNMAFVAGPRAVWQVSKDKDDPRKRLFLPVKNNLADDSEETGLSFGVEGVEMGFDDAGGLIKTSRIMWNDERVTISADEASGYDSLSHDERGGLAEAREFLTETLAEGRVKAKEVERLAKAAGVSLATLGRAKRSMGVRSEKEGFAATTIWYWKLAGERAAIDDTPPRSWTPD